MARNVEIKARIDGLPALAARAAALAEPGDTGRDVALDLMERVHVDPGQLIEGVYVDLLARTGVSG